MHERNVKKIYSVILFFSAAYKLSMHDNIVLGSDYPFPLGEDVPGKLIEDTSHLSKTTKEKTLGVNALKLLGLELKDFI